MSSSEALASTGVLGRLGVFGGVLAGVVGLLVTFACVAVPGLHFVLGPLGPLIGGLVLGRLIGGVFRRGVAGVLTMAAGTATLAAAFTGVLVGEEASSGLARAVPVIVFLYTGALASVGAFFGAATAPRS